jgi:peroxiredoxin Q/BCP
VSNTIGNFDLIATSDIQSKFYDLFCNKHLVLYFYPRDNTPGCTTESIDFGKLHSKFAKLDCSIFGISRDRLVTHTNFKKKLNLPFDLISDTSEEICNIFDVMRDKNMYGKKVRGIERSTFIFDDKKQIVKSWHKVKVDGHAQEVLEYIENITN